MTEKFKKIEKYFESLFSVKCEVEYDLINISIVAILSYVFYLNGAKEFVMVKYNIRQEAIEEDFVLKDEEIEKIKQKLSITTEF